MENPYASPKAHIEDRGTKSNKRSIWWKIYFFFITATSVLGTISILLSPKASIIDYLDTMMTVIATAGLFGFVFGKRIFAVKFWIPFLIIYLISDIAYDQLTKVNMHGDLTNAQYYISTVIGYLLALPGYFGLYKYGRKSTYPWSAD